MSLQEMIEMAILDAMGLLDEREQSSFESAFRASSPAVQAQVRREQTRLSRIESLLPDVAPPSGLRAAVLTAVRAEMASTAKVDDGVFVPTLLKNRGVSPLWRAASLGLAAAAIVLAVTTFQWKRQNTNLMEMLKEDALLSKVTQQMGATYVQDVLFSRDTKRVLFRPVADGFTGVASIFVNPEWKSAKLFGKSISTPEGQSYRLALIDDQDHIVRVLDSISSDGRLFTKDLKMAPNLSGKLAIVGPEDGSSNPPVILGKADLSS